MISSWYIVITFLKEFDRGADFWARISGSGADGPNDWFLGGVIDVSEVPRKEEINTVYCRDRKYMENGRIILLCSLTPVFIVSTLAGFPHGIYVGYASSVFM